jgi:hypothetical protein
MAAADTAPTLVVMAAGMGSRYGGLKQIDPVGPHGEIVIDYSVYDAIRAGFGKVVFIIRRDIEAAFRDVVEKNIAGRIEVAYAFQELDDLPTGYRVPEGRTKPWGTSHAILACRHIVKENFAVINADDFYGAASYRILGDWLRGADPDRDRYCLISYIMRNTLSDHGTVSRGVCETRHGLLTKIIERLKIEKQGEAARFLEGDEWVDATGDEPVSMNMWGFTPRVFPNLLAVFPSFLDAAAGNPKAEFLIPTSIDAMIQQGKAEVEVPQSPERWLGVTYPEDKPLVAAGIREMIEAGKYPENLWG